MTDLAQQAQNDGLFKRQTGFFDPNAHDKASVTFVGVGGIGSFAAFSTAKLGVPNLTLIDPDTVEEHNVPNQFSPFSRVGESKVEALAAEIASHMGESVAVTTEAIKLDQHAGYRGVVASGLDSMTARHEMWEQVKMNIEVPLYLDGRISGQRMILYTLNPTNLRDIEKYEETLHGDGEAEPAHCTERGLIDVGFQIGALITRQIRRHFAGEDPDHIITMSMKTLTMRKGDWL